MKDVTQAVKVTVMEHAQVIAILLVLMDVLDVAHNALVAVVVAQEVVIHNVADVANHVVLDVVLLVTHNVQHHAHLHALLHVAHNAMAHVQVVLQQLLYKLKNLYLQLINKNIILKENDYVKNNYCKN